MRLVLVVLALGALALGVVLAARRGGSPPRVEREQGDAPAAEPDAPARRTARIVGTIRNERGEGVSGAGVRAKDAAGNRLSAEVARDGSYALDDLQPGRYAVAAWTPGHWRPKPQEVEAPAGGEARCDFVAHRGFVLRGRVKDTRDHAVAGIDIRPSFNEDQIAISDASGVFDLGGFGGKFETVDVVVRDPKGRYAPWEGDVFEGVVITLDDGATIEGEVVRRETGAPVAGARLRFREERPVYAGYTWPQAGEATSARDGTFRIAARPAGRCVLEASAPGLSPQRREIEARAGRTTPVRIELGAGGSVELTVLNPEGRPVPGTKVMPAELLYTMQRSEEPLPDIRTGPDGRALLEHVEPGRRRVGAQANDFLPVTAPVDVPGDGRRVSLTLSLRRGGAIEGRMPPRPAMGCVIVMSRDHAFYREVTPGADGIYRAAGLASGDYHVICGFRTGVTVIEGETVRCDLDTPQGNAGWDFGGEVGPEPRPGDGRIRARVVGPDGLPVFCALVAVLDETGAPLAQWFGHGLGVTVPAPPLADFPIPGLAAGAYDIVAVVPRGGFARAKGIRIPESGIADVSLAIGEGGTVEVTVADARTGVLTEGARVHVALPPGSGVPDTVDPFRVNNAGDGGLFFRRDVAVATDAAGIARLDGLSAGEYKGRAETSDGRAAEFAFTIRDGETTRVRAELNR